MSGYDRATTRRIETSFGNMLRSEPKEEYRFLRLYDAVSYKLFPRRSDLESRKATAEFFRRLADYADKKASEAGA